MHMVIEQWRYKATWKALPPADRQAFVAGVGAAVGQLAAAGITTLGFGLNDPATDHRADYDFWAIWQCPDAAGANTFQKAVAGSGWYELFEHRNMSGEVLEPGVVLEMHIAV